MVVVVVEETDQHQMMMVQKIMSRCNQGQVQDQGQHQVTKTWKATIAKKKQKISALDLFSVWT